MFSVNKFSFDPQQKQTIILPDNSRIQLQVEFKPQQYGWFIVSLVYNTFTLTGLRITNSPNFLRQFQHQIPFGMACFSKDGREPTHQEDFSSAQSQLFILTAAEVQQYEDFLNGV